MSPANRKFTAQEKAAILKKHPIEDIPISKICKKYGMSPSTLYEWRNKSFTNAPLSFGNQTTRSIDWNLPVQHGRA
jgi:transposase-like protein